MINNYIIIIIIYLNTYNYCSLISNAKSKNWISILYKNFFSLFVHRLNWIWTHVFLLIICNLFNGREVFFSCIEMVNCDLVHCYVHDRTMTSMSSLTREVRLAYMWSTIAHIGVINTESATWVFFLNFLRRLKYRRQ